MTAQPTEPPAEPDEAPETAPEPEAPVQPADAPDAPPPSNVVELRTERGSLTLRPNQTSLDPNQRAALVAIGIDVAKDPAVEPHIRPFIHMCQTKGLDPWAKEAYLIGRGRDNNRTYTMQTGIDGYRKMAASTGRFIRIKETLWTGPDDDDRSYYRDERGIMRRVWYDQWPASRGYPGAAKVVIEHYDDANNVVETEAVADWSMYAPFVDEWEWDPNVRGKKVFKTNPDGSKAQTLTEMWRKGYAHMLAKCAEALCHRKAFPARMSGIYVAEEMHRLDQHERDRLAAEQAAARQAAYKAATAPKAKAGLPAAPVVVGDVLSEVVDAAGRAETAPAAPEARQEATEPGDAPESNPDTSPEQRAAWLYAELEYQSGILGHGITTLAARAMRALRKNPEDFTDAELLGVVSSLRPAVAARLRADGSEDEADSYSTITATDVLDVLAFLDGATDTFEAETVPDEPVDPDVEHAPRLGPDGICDVCGLPENVGPHPEG